MDKSSLSTLSDIGPPVPQHSDAGQIEQSRLLQRRKHNEEWLIDFDGSGDCQSLERSGRSVPTPPRPVTPQRRATLLAFPVTLQPRLWECSPSRIGAMTAPVLVRLLSNPSFSNLPRQKLICEMHNPF